MEIMLADPTKNFTFDPVKFCIYCGFTEQHNKRLGKEHIFPLGLGGGLILPKASCEACSKITSAVERKLLRGPFWPVRVKLGIHSGRRPGQQPTDFDAEFWKGHNRNRFLRQLSAKDEPVILMLPGFYAPSLLSGETIEGSNGFNQIFVCSFGNNSIIENLDSLIASAKSDGIGLGSVTDPITLQRMIAKILHGLAYADFSGRFIPYLNKFILGSDIDNSGKLVGSRQGEIEIGTSIHSIGLGTCQIREKNVLVGGVSLFTQQTNHLYIAAIGEIIS